MNFLPGYDEAKEWARFENAAREICDDLAMEGEEGEGCTDYIAELLGEWAQDNNSRLGIVLQIAASQEFGGKLSSFTMERLAAYGINASGDFTLERAVMRSLHTSWVHRPMVLYRGTDVRENNLLASWTTSRAVAEFYAERNGGQVIERQFKAEDILATWEQGLGLEAAQEVVVINR